jgi:hypothetical protein
MRRRNEEEKRRMIEDEEKVKEKLRQHKDKTEL